MWLEILGIRVHWNRMKRDVTSQLPIQKDKKQTLFTAAWIADYYDPHDFFVDSRWNRLATNEILWDHHEYNNLIQKAKGVMNQEERIDLYRQADRLIVEEAPIIPLYYEQKQSLQKPWVKGFAFWPAMEEFFEDIIIEEH
jgi:ABC-type oligopeptide transport system substrate-binding subunit